MKDLNFKSPPVWELGISVGLPAPGWFNPYDIRQIHDLFRRRFAVAERQPSFVAFQPFPVHATAVSPRPVIQFEQSPDLNRWWFVSEDGSDLVQVQETFIARNWRRLVPPPAASAPYPGFDAIFGDFRDIVATAGQWSASRGESFPEPVVCELLYENLIPTTAGDGTKLRASEIIVPLNFDPPIFAGGMTLSWFEFVNPEQKEGPFTLQVTIQFVGVPSPDGSGIMSVIKLSFAARSPCSTWSGAFDFIEAAHQRLRQRLVDLTTDTVRATWGQE